MVDQKSGKDSCPACPDLVGEGSPPRRATKDLASIPRPLSICLPRASREGSPPRLSERILKRRQRFQDFRGPRAIQHGIVFANFSVAKHHDAFRELRNIKLVGDDHDR